MNRPTWAQRARHGRSYFQIKKDLVQEKLASIFCHAAERLVNGGVAFGGLGGLRVLPLQTVDGLSEEDRTLKFSRR